MEAIVLASGAAGLLAILFTLLLSILNAVRQSEARALHRSAPASVDSESQDAAA